MTLLLVVLVPWLRLLLALTQMIMATLTLLLLLLVLVKATPLITLLLLPAKAVGRPRAKLLVNGGRCKGNMLYLL
jgi:hypothetical protein